MMEKTSSIDSRQNAYRAAANFYRCQCHTPAAPDMAKSQTISSRERCVDQPAMDYNARHSTINLTKHTYLGI